MEAKLQECGRLTEKEQYSLLEDAIKDFEYKEDNLIQILHMAQAQPSIDLISRNSVLKEKEPLIYRKNKWSICSKTHDIDRLR